MEKKKSKYDLNDWEDIFSEISYAYERQYPPTYEEAKGIKYICFYKLTLDSLGRYSYKSTYGTFDPKLWYKIELLYKLFTEDKTLEVLYGNNE